MVTTFPGAVLESLTFGHSQVVAHSGEFYADQLTATNIYIRVAGRITVVNSNITSTFLDSSKDSVFVIGGRNSGEGVEIKYRQPEDRIATKSWGSNLPALVADTGMGPTAYCDIFKMPNYKRWWQAVFPVTYGYGHVPGVTGIDFESAYDKTGICCGNFCPVISVCRNWRFSIYNGSLDWISFEDLATQIQDQNITQLAHFHPDHQCFQTLTMNYGSTQRSMYVAALGQIQVELYHNSTEVGEHQEWIHPNLNPVYRNSKVAQGEYSIIMNKHDADKMHVELQSYYKTEVMGGNSSSEDVFAVIDVMASPGVPGGRWIYTTKEFYLTLPPHVMSFLTGGMLMPEIKYYEVHLSNPFAFNSSSNFLGTNWVNETAKWKAQAEVFAQIEYTLRQSWRSCCFWRGQIVHVEGGRTSIFDSSNLVTFDYNYQSKTLEKVNYTNRTQTITYLALSFSVAIAIIASAMVIHYATKFGKHALKQMHRGETLRNKLADIMENASAHSHQKDEAVIQQNPKTKGTMDVLLHRMKACGFDPWELSLYVSTYKILKPLRAKVQRLRMRLVSKLWCV